MNKILRLCQYHTEADTTRDLLDKQTEQMNAMSTMFLWQKQAARKSILSCVGTDISCRRPGGAKNDICHG